MATSLYSKRQKKNKTEPKEQRKPRTSRVPANLPPANKDISEKEKPSSQDPGPEFYQNLKRETDDILKITEETNAKYSKKIIQSNWKKYEVPIETYDERQEVEDMGADFEQLVNAPVSSGHFQFKHEKAWDTVVEATQYDKYFEIDMANLALSLSSIPFHERNNLDLSLFSQSDVTTMKHRADKFKNKLKPMKCEKINVSDGNLNQQSIPDSYKEKYNVCISEIMSSKLENEIDTNIFKEFEDTDVTKISKPLESTDGANITRDNVKLINSQVQESVKELSDDELDILLGIKEVTGNNKDQKITAGLETGFKTDNDVAKAQVKPAGSNNPMVLEAEDDLEEWLEDILSK